MVVGIRKCLVVLSFVTVLVFYVSQLLSFAFKIIILTPRDIFT